MTTLQKVYATDEDVAIRAPADFPILCPRDQKIAAATDGLFDPSNPWTLISGSVNFSTIGLVPGQVVQLTKPTSSFRPPGELLVVASVAPGSVQLRRKGQALGSGQPPGMPGGLTGVEFAVATLAPQIEAASYDLNRRYGIDDLISGRRSGDLYDPREVRDATVLTALYRQYLSMSREADDHRDNFASKARALKDELDDLLARVVVHWVSGSSPGSDPATARFSTRLVR